MGRFQVRVNLECSSLTDRYRLSYAAKFIVPDWGGGDKVDSGIGLSYRPARLHRLAGRYASKLCRSQLDSPFRDYVVDY